MRESAILSTCYWIQWLQLRRHRIFALFAFQLCRVRFINHDSYTVTTDITLGWTTTCLSEKSHYFPPKLIFLWVILRPGTYIMLKFMSKNIWHKLITIYQVHIFSFIYIRHRYNVWKAVIIWRDIAVYRLLTMFIKKSALRIELKIGSRALKRKWQIWTLYRRFIWGSWS